MKVEFYRHALGAAERQKVAECLEGMFLTTGAYVADFEAALADYLDIDHCVGVTSCTAALHLALVGLGIGPGDEVITTPLTFIATATAILHAGARPVLVDVEPNTGLIDPAAVAAAVNERTRAVIPVHLYGQMCDMHALRAVADRHDLKIIEDAAHCIEGRREGIRPGQLGDAVCFSFYATKNITAGEGGAVATHDPVLAERLVLLRNHGMSKQAADRYSGNYQHWDMLLHGWKYNMSNIQAALLLPQMARIDDLAHQRRELYRAYRRLLAPVEGVAVPALVDNAISAHHLFTIWVAAGRRDAVLKIFGEAGVGVAVNYRAIHLLTYFKAQLGYLPGQFPAAEKIGAETISLPFWVGLGDDQIDHVVRVLGQALDG